MQNPRAGVTQSPQHRSPGSIGKRPAITSSTTMSRTAAPSSSNNSVMMASIPRSTHPNAPLPEEMSSPARMPASPPRVEQSATPGTDPTPAVLAAKRTLRQNPSSPHPARPTFSHPQQNGVSCPSQKTLAPSGPSERLMTPPGLSDPERWDSEMAMKPPSCRPSLIPPPASLGMSPPTSGQVSTSPTRPQSSNSPPGSSTTMESLSI